SARATIPKALELFPLPLPQVMTSTPALRVAAAIFLSTTFFLRAMRTLCRSVRPSFFVCSLSMIFLCRHEHDALAVPDNFDGMAKAGAEQRRRQHIARRARMPAAVAHQQQRM